MSIGAYSDLRGAAPEQIRFPQRGRPGPAGPRRGLPAARRQPGDGGLEPRGSQGKTKTASLSARMATRLPGGGTVLSATRARNSLPSSRRRRTRLPYPSRRLSSTRAGRPAAPSRVHRRRPLGPYQDIDPLALAATGRVDRTDGRIDAGPAHDAVNPVQIAQEAGDEGRGRPAVDAGRLARLDQRALLQNGDAVARIHRLLGVMGDQENAGGKLAQNVQRVIADRLAQAHVQTREGLVEQQDRGARRQGARQGHALLLAAGEHVGVLAAAPLQTHRAQHAGHDVAATARALPAQSEGDVVGHGHMRKERELLKHEAHATRFGRQMTTRPGDRAPRHRHLAPLQALQAGRQAKRGRLAATRRPHQAHDLALADLQVEPPQRRRAVIAVADAAEGQSRHGLIRAAKRRSFLQFTRIDNRARGGTPRLNGRRSPSPPPRRRAPRGGRPREGRAGDRAGPRPSSPPCPADRPGCRG